MNLVLLTTDTAHHRYFAWKIAERYPFRGILVEGGRAEPRFETHHPFEDERDAYEREVLLAGCRSGLEDFAETVRVEGINDAPALEAMDRFQADVAVIFGTRRIRTPMIRRALRNCLNLHGGNPEEYRGLDSHLWAIYHEDFGNLQTTLHQVDRGLDTGDIVGRIPLALERGMRLSHLRSVNTRACVSLTERALEEIRSRGTLAARPQARRGRYYSFMPAVLKDGCVARFERHVSSR
ncbi:MAG TPA: formyltransferase family protein [Planctomycetota bacterium]|nr:formyltransferase family protein [Planctomycetota bacterium]